MSIDAEMKSVECHLHALMCSVSVVTVVFIHTMEDDQRLNTLVHEGDTLHFSIARRQFQHSDSVFSCSYVTLQLVKTHFHCSPELSIIEYYLGRRT